MNEKQQIEEATGEGFLVLYNAKFSSNYSVKELADSPDVRCIDKIGNILNLEITLTEDRDKDIQAALGRSKHRDLKTDLLEMGSSQSGEVFEKLAVRIQDKILKRYGPNTALVIRDVSGVDWDWDYISDDIGQRFLSDFNPFDKGIWVINNTKTRIFRVL